MSKYISESDNNPVYSDGERQSESLFSIDDAEYKLKHGYSRYYKPKEAKTKLQQLDEAMEIIWAIK